MASNINPNNIDGTYPVAGQDNDSQGFRNNFTNISNNFSVAATEISDIQAKAVLTSALVGGTLNNNMAGSSISAVQLTGAGYTLQSLGTVSGAVALNFSYGNIQEITPSGPILLSFNTWPAGGSYANMIVWLNISSTAYTVSFSTSNPGVTEGLSQVAGSSVVGSTGTITFDEPGTYLLSFSTLDSGNNLLITDLTRNFVSLRGQELYYNPDVNTTLLVGYGAALPTALALEQGQDIVSAFGSYNSVHVGNLSLANIANPITNVGPISGYSVTSARGNAMIGSLQPVASGDLLGYVNSIGFTGNSAGNVFQQMSSVGFYATGSNVTYGYGGNIAFFTKKDGVGTLNTGIYPVSQALGLENDQSTHHYGNLFLSTTGTSSSYYPATSSSAGSPGQVAWANISGTYYFYVCIATNTWARTTLSASF